jgi:hypothetical protein
MSQEEKPQHDTQPPNPTSSSSSSSHSSTLKTVETARFLLNASLMKKLIMQCETDKAVNELNDMLMRTQEPTHLKRVRKQYETEKAVNQLNDVLMNTQE